MQKAGNILPLIFVCIRQSSVHQLLMINTVRRRQLHLKHTVHKKSPTNQSSIFFCDPQLGLLTSNTFQLLPEQDMQSLWRVQCLHQSLRPDGCAWNTFKGGCPGGAQTTSVDSFRRQEAVVLCLAPSRCLRS